MARMADARSCAARRAMAAVGGRGAGARGTGILLLEGGGVRASCGGARAGRGVTVRHAICVDEGARDAGHSCCDGARWGTQKDAWHCGHCVSEPTHLNKRCAAAGAPRQRARRLRGTTADERGASAERLGRRVPVALEYLLCHSRRVLAPPAWRRRVAQRAQRHQHVLALVRARVVLRRAVLRAKQVAARGAAQWQKIFTAARVAPFEEQHRVVRAPPRQWPRGHAAS